MMALSPRRFFYNGSPVLTLVPITLPAKPLMSWWEWLIVIWFALDVLFIIWWSKIVYKDPEDE